MFIDHKWIENKIAAGSNFSDLVPELIKSGEISKKTKKNQPFTNFLPLSIFDKSLVRVNHPLYTIGKRAHQVLARKLRIRRDHDVKIPWSNLPNADRKLILPYIDTELINLFTHISQVMEVRQDSIFAGYVYNHVMYIGYGNKIIY
jgi:hypothetical protein